MFPPGGPAASGALLCLIVAAVVGAMAVFAAVSLMIAPGRGELTFYCRRPRLIGPQIQYGTEHKIRSVLVRRSLCSFAASDPLAKRNMYKRL